MSQLPIDCDALAESLSHADELRDAKRFEEARRAYEALIGEYPDHPDPHFKLGTLHGRMDDPVAAEASYREATKRSPQHPGANNNLGLISLARGDLDQAERFFRESLAGDRLNADAHINLASLLIETTRLLEAEYIARRAIELSPKSALAHARLAQVKRANGEMTQAIQTFETALDLDPGSPAILTDLGNCLWNIGRHERARSVLERAIEAGPESIPAWNNLLFQSNYVHADRAWLFERYKEFGRMIRRRCGDLVVSDCPSPGACDPARRLRIGFISADFRRHSVTYFLRAGIELLDRRNFELYAYHAHRGEDEMTWELKPLFHVWRPIYGKPDQAVADLIRGDRIDVLIDLSGHTAGARPLVLGRKPAPVIAHWLGYPNTLGLDCVDYRLTDTWADPEESSEAYSCERLFRLRRPFLCYSPLPTAPDVATPPSVESRIIRFGSFNSRAKLSDECVATWVEILKRVPDSRLVLKSLFGTGDDESRADLRSLFSSKGIAEDRIEVLKVLGETTDHLKAYEQVDIALDTFPYNGTTTTCEALWMGLPVVALAGNSHAARVGVTILTSLGFDSLIAPSREDYIDLAVSLAESPEALADLRSVMRARMQSSPLMDKKGMALALGSALRQMWRDYCATQPGESGADAEAEQPQELLRLHIGGQEAREGWKVVDCQPRPEVDYVANVEDLTVFPDGCAQAIYCSHVLEHVSQADMQSTLYGLYRILAPGGVLYISVPDLETLSWLMVSPLHARPDKFHVMRMIFGGQTDEHDFHRIGLTFGFMEDFLREAGFSSWEHVESFGLFRDSSEVRFDGHPVSLNLIVRK